MSRPQSRIGVKSGAQSYGLFPMNVNGTMLMSAAMPEGNDPYKRIEDQIPTADTRRLSLGMEAPQTSCDVGRYERAHTGRYTPDPGAKKSSQMAGLDLTALSSGRPSCWTPAPDTVDDLQRKVDDVQRRIYELNQEVLPPRQIGTEKSNAYLGNPAYNNRLGGGMPYVRTIGTPQPDPQKYVVEAKKRGEFDYESANGRAKR